MRTPRNPRHLDPTDCDLSTSANRWILVQFNYFNLSMCRPSRHLGGTTATIVTTATRFPGAHKELTYRPGKADALHRLE